MFHRVHNINHVYLTDPFCIGKVITRATAGIERAVANEKTRF